MKEEIIWVRNGIAITSLLLKTYSYGKLFFSQERVVVTDMKNCEIASQDIIDLVMPVMSGKMYN